MLKGHAVADAELARSSGGRSDEDTAEIDPATCDPVVTRPRAQHLARATGQVQDPITPPQPHGPSQHSQLLLAERVMDPVV
jgi:hypothetical protein